MPIGIMAAMQEEIDTLLKELPANSEVVDDGRRTYHSGHLWGTPVVVVFSRWGKVAAACGLNPIVIVLNNHGYGTERFLLEGNFNEIPDAIANM